MNRHSMKALMRGKKPRPRRLKTVPAVPVLYGVSPLVQLWPVWNHYNILLDHILQSFGIPADLAR